MIASHYAEPLLRHLTAPAALRRSPAAEAEAVLDLSPGEDFWLLDATGGWAWGYGGADRRVGYIPAEALGI